jgi:hypothetical protein
MKNLNLSYQFIVNYGSTPITQVSVKPGNDNVTTALRILETAVDVAKGKETNAKGKITKNESGTYNYIAGPFSVINLSEEIIEASLKGRLTTDNLEEIALEKYISSKRVEELLAEKEEQLEILPLQIEELKRVLPLVQFKEAKAKPVRGYAIAYKEEYMKAEAEKATMAAELAELKAMVEELKASKEKKVKVAA